IDRGSILLSVPPLSCTNAAAGMFCHSSRSRMSLILFGRIPRMTHTSFAPNHGSPSLSITRISASSPAYVYFITSVIPNFLPSVADRLPSTSYLMRSPKSIPLPVKIIPGRVHVVQRTLKGAVRRSGGFDVLTKLKMRDSRQVKLIEDHAHELILRRQQ